ncbi:MAG: hypothetical protein KGJ13_07810 [Patescibacteria group bacterium]|nr:hypothetical protein [Patescibacteria group bacterium]
MPTFDTYVARHGEGWTLFIVEQIERNEGIRYRNPVSLEERWNVLRGGDDFTGAPAMRLAA